MGLQGYPTKLSALWDKIVIHLTKFSTMWDKIVILVTKFSTLSDKIVIPSPYKIFKIFGTLKDFKFHDGEFL